MSQARHDDGERNPFTNWLVYTCLIGLMPIIARLFVWSISDSGVEAFAISDIVAFGLVLHSVNISEVNKVAAGDDAWKNAFNGTSILFLVIYALLLFTTILPDSRLNQHSLLSTSIGLGVFSFVLSASILYRSAYIGGRAT